MKYQTKVKWYTLPEVDGPVKPVNGEKLERPAPSWSCGFTHFVFKDGKVGGFCGIEYFERNAKVIS
jgi:hypothetical protein